MSKLVQRWCVEVVCDCGAEGWEWGYAVDDQGSTNGSIVSPMPCTCPNWPEWKFAWLWGPPRGRDWQGCADTFDEALRQLMQEAAKGLSDDR